MKPRSLVATIHLPDVRMRFFLNFEFKKETNGSGGDLKSIDRILGKASNLSPELQEVLAKFLEFLDSEEKERAG